jgi:DNA helicase HerA-like ATPase
MENPPSLIIGGSGGQKIRQLGKVSNRHGLIAGATGTGKTVTLQVLAEGFSRMGVPVFAADIKGDLSGLASAGKPHPKIDERVTGNALDDYQQRPYPVVFWDLFGRNGHPIRTTISDMGPLLLSSLLELNDTQQGVLYATFSVADDNGMLLLDLKDLRSMLSWVSENRKELEREYGNLAPASISAIQRKLLVLEEQGGENFFGEPALQLQDLMLRDFSGNGVINLLDATELTHKSPKLYATLLLWLMAELFEQLPEVGNPDVPKLVFFFDEAHLLFDDAPKALLDKIEQVVRLIRSKGVGIYFVTQSPLDIPEDVLGQLGLKIQHALRAFTPKDHKAVKMVAQTFRQNPAFDTEQEITQLGTGFALVSVFDAKGSPSPVASTMISPPESRIGPVTEAERKERIARSPLAGRYDKEVDRESAYELLAQRAKQMEEAAAAEAERQARLEEREREEKSRKRSRSSNRQSIGEALTKSVVRSVGSQLGRYGGQLLRGLLGSLLGGKR